MELSIIVPVYNVETYFSKCLDSILNQTFTDFECILVNDGSKDNSLAICKDYAIKDVRFKIVDKENSELNCARYARIKVLMIIMWSL